MSDPTTAALIAAAYQHADAHPALAAAVAEHQRVQSMLDRLLVPSSRCVRGPRGRAVLTNKESDLLRVLAAAGGKAVAKDDLGRHVWPLSGQTFKESHTLATHLFRLRQKMGDVGACARVVTEQAGYRLEPVA